MVCALGALVFVVTAAIFLPALRNEFVVWDDDLNLVDNARYRGLDLPHLAWMFTTVHGGHYQPLSWVTFALDHAVWGMNPAGYHLTSILLHAGTAAVFYAVLRRLLDGAAGRAVAATAAFGALLFALHPLRVESVVWASERRDVLSGFFYLLTALAYLRMIEARERHAPWRPWYGVSLVCFVLSLLSKAWGITLPVVLLVLDVHPLRRFAEHTHGRATAIVLEKLPYALLAIVGAAMAFAAQWRVPAMRSLADQGLVARAAQAAYGLAFYLWKTVLPWRLSPLYLLEQRLDPLAARYLGAALVVAGITVGALVVRRRWPSLLTAWVCYGVIASPVLGFAQTGPQIAADRYTYLACLPWAALAAAGAGRLWAARGVPARTTLAVGIGVLVALGALTVRQTRIWRTSLALWDHAVALDATNYIAWTNRGWARHLAGDSDAAIADYDAALRINPTYFMAHKNRGFTRQLRGDLRGALEDYDAAIAANPRHAESWYDRGTVRQAMGDPAGAVADYTESIRRDPDDPRAYNNRGWLRQGSGDLAGAADDYTRALAVAAPGSPGRARIEGNLAALRERLGRP